MDVSRTLERLTGLAEQMGFSQDSVNLASFVSSGTIGSQCSESLKIHSSACSWQQHYPVLSYLMTGHLHTNYERLIGLPPRPRSSTQWSRIVRRLESYVTDLAEWSCGQVKKKIVERGDE